MSTAVAAPPGVQQRAARGPAPPYRDDSSSVSTVQEEGDEVWCDARDTPADEQSIRASMDINGDELDEEDLDRSGSAPGIDIDGLSEGKAVEGHSVPKPTPQSILTTTLEQSSSSVTSPVDSEPNGLPGLAGEYPNDAPLAMSTPELSYPMRSAPRSAQSLDVMHPHNTDRPVSPTPTSQSTGLDRQNSRRRSTADVRAIQFATHLR